MADHAGEVTIEARAEVDLDPGSPDVTRLDAVVISHRHGDHANGLCHVLAVNPDIPIDLPADEYFGATTPAEAGAPPPATGE